MKRLYSCLSLLLLIVALGLCLGIGYLLGRRALYGGRPIYQPTSTDLYQGSDITSDEASAKLVYLFDLLRDRYVDTLDLQHLVEDAIPTIVEELDPHSVYIPAVELDEVNSQLEGSFSGVGIQFNIQQDTVMVIQVISGGPSERVGIMPGDRIVTVDDSLFCGKASGINNDRVLKTLRGEKGSHVVLGIRRNTSPDVLTFDVTRGDIPVNSVVAQYVENQIGYIKVDNFGRNTYNEFFTALINLKARGAQGYLIDLRANGGGYMEVCCQMVNEFLGRGDLIVFTEGKTYERQEICADGVGNFQQCPVVVMIDEWSASASEIFAGAIQDNDRGYIVGRRSFGKGLVQQQFDLYDGSALRLTIARYHTPSGRCIQKPYEMGEGDRYQEDILHRYEHGEFWSADSIQQNDSLLFYTVGGRKVYGGGGIMPDYFVPVDTTYSTRYYNRCVNLGVIYSFAFQYSDSHREELSRYSDYDQLLKHLKSLGLLSRFTAFAADQCGLPSAADLHRSGADLERLIYAYIMRQCKDEDYFYRQFNAGDATYHEAMKLIRTTDGVVKIDK